jgi:hypothetical protein
MVAGVRAALLAAEARAFDDGFVTASTTYALR